MSYLDAVCSAGMYRRASSDDVRVVFALEVKSNVYIDSKKFSGALIVFYKAFQCESIADKLTMVNCLPNLLAEQLLRHDILRITCKGMKMSANVN